MSANEWLLGILGAIAAAGIIGFASFVASLLRKLASDVDQIKRDLHDHRFVPRRVAHIEDHLAWRPEVPFRPWRPDVGEQKP